MQREIKDELQRALEQLGYTQLRQIQEDVFDAFGTGHDLYVQALTGSGKTLAYLLPVLNSIDSLEQKTKAVIIAPTRELAQQIHRTCTELSSYMIIHTACMIGGTDPGQQLAALKQSPEIIIGTAGRLLDLMNRGLIRTDFLQYIILDEADQLLSLGQKEEITSLLGLLPPVQTAFFSATMNESLHAFLKPDVIDIKASEIRINPDIRQYYSVSKTPEKDLLQILHSLPVHSAIIFFQYRSQCNKITGVLQDNRILCASLTGEMNQKKRTSVLNLFRKGDIRILCTTDVSARGLDIPDVSHVIHYGLPFDRDSLIHRAGRSMHEGGEGISILLLSEEEAESELGILMKNQSHELQIGPGLDSDLSIPIEKEIHSVSDVRTYYLRAGRQDGLRVKDIVGALCSVVPFEKIGTVDVKPDHSVIQIMSSENISGTIKIKGSNRRLEVLKK